MQHVKPNGAGWAAAMAASIACFTLGISIVLSEAIPPLKTMLILNRSVGPLSGKTTLATLVFFVAWMILHNQWKERNLNSMRLGVVMAAVLLVAFVFDFPPFFELFTAH